MYVGNSASLSVISLIKYDEFISIHISYLLIRFDVGDSNIDILYTYNDFLVIAILETFFSVLELVPSNSETYGFVKSVFIIEMLQKLGFHSHNTSSSHKSIE